MTQEVVESDVLVIGGGLAGTFAAIKAKEAGARKVILVSKGKLGKDSISTFAAGVWAGITPEDNVDDWLKKYIFSVEFGGGLYDEEWMNVTLKDMYPRLLDMERWGVEWEKTPDGKFKRYEMRWKTPQCMFHGPQMMEAMARKVKRDGIQVIGHTMITDLLTENGQPGERVTGVVGFEVRTGEYRVFRAKAIVLAAGGCSFKARFGCMRFQTGEAYSMAYRAGAELGNFEMGEILHTTATEFATQGLNMFVGLGGKFVNSLGEEFLFEYAPEMGNHTSMGRFSEASAMEVRGGRGPIYLDMTHFSPEDVRLFRAVLPIPAKIFERAGVMVGDRIARKVEWAPAFYGTIASGGGVSANTKCETSLQGLYACGDAMARTESIPRALPGAAVSGAIAGISAARFAAETNESKIRADQVEQIRNYTFAPSRKEVGMEPDHVILELHECLLPYEVTVISRGDRMEKALQEIERIRDEEIHLLRAADAHYLRLANEVKTMVLVAEMYLKSRLFRKESRDACAREDYPYVDNLNWLKWIRLKQDNSQMKLWTEDAPVDQYKVKPIRARSLYPVFEVARRRGIEWG